MCPRSRPARHTLEEFHLLAWKHTMAMYPKAIWPESTFRITEEPGIGIRARPGRYAPCECSKPSPRAFTCNAGAPACVRLQTLSTLSSHPCFQLLVLFNSHESTFLFSPLQLIPHRPLSTAGRLIAEIAQSSIPTWLPVLLLAIMLWRRNLNLNLYVAPLVCRPHQEQPKPRPSPTMRFVSSRPPNGSRRGMIVQPAIVTYQPPRSQNTSLPTTANT